MSESITGTMPRGIVVEEGLSFIENESFNDRIEALCGAAAGLAIDGPAYDPEGEAIDSLLSQSPSRHIPKRRSMAPSNKRMRLEFGVGGKYINRAVSAGSFGKLTPEVRLLVGFGLLTSSGLRDCLKTGEQRTNFLEKIVNKGQSETAERVSTEGIGDLLEDATKQGFLAQISPGDLALTEAGMDYLLSDEMLLHKLKSPMPIS